MKQLLWAEKQKLRRSKLIWITIFATIMVAVIVFAQGQFVFHGSRYVDNTGWFTDGCAVACHFFCSSCSHCPFRQLYDLPRGTRGYDEVFAAYSGE